MYLVNPSTRKADIYLTMSTLAAVLFVWVSHEFAHWLTNELLGYSSVMTLNSTFLSIGSYSSSVDHMMVSAAGPIVTIGIAIAAYLYLYFRKWNPDVYIILLTAFYMRLIASGMNFINPNDEGRISSELGLGLFALPSLVSLVLFAMVYFASKKYQLRSGYITLLVLLIMVFSSVLILSDQIYKFQVL